MTMRFASGSSFVVDLNEKRRDAGVPPSRIRSAVACTFVNGGGSVVDVEVLDVDVVVGTGDVDDVDVDELVLLVVVDDVVVVVTMQLPDAFGKLPGSAGSVAQSSSRR